MKYFLDTEFHEYKKKPLIGKPIDTIELISIGIVSENNEVLKQMPEPYFKGQTSIQRAKTQSNIDGKEYYAICKDFDIEAAWNANQGTKENPKYWLRENVLKPIWEELSLKFNANAYKFNSMGLPGYAKIEPLPFTCKTMKKLIKNYGKTREQIAEEIKKFIYDGYLDDAKHVDYLMTGIPDNWMIKQINLNPIKFYAYYADYDWVVFCWLFGRMIDLPKGFPMYCRDLKQILDEKQELSKWVYSFKFGGVMLKDRLTNLKYHPNYPKQTNEHNSLDDALFNKRLYYFLQNL